MDYDNEMTNEKRAPYGFVGMRGKKSFDEDYFTDNGPDNDDVMRDFDKRAPRGFFAMRGKKSTELSEFPNL